MNIDLKALSFEDLLIWTCAQQEDNLRTTAKEVLVNYGFSYKEDEYKTYREVDGINNILFTRGDPQFCLVAHTDVCRDHTASRNGTLWMNPEPVFKDLDGRKIIQDKNNEVQVGGDDRVGVAISLWCALHTDKPISILFTTDEEVGLVSAEEVKFEELNNYKLLIQIDRGNNTNQIVNKISKLDICDEETTNFIAEKMASLNMNREFVVGKLTDVYAIKKNQMCKNAINMTCGYYNSKYDSPLEYIDVEEANDTKNLVIGLIS